MSELSPFDFVKAVTSSKIDLIKDDPDAISGYVPFIVNRSLSYHADCLFYANELNRYWELPKEAQFKFYLNSLRRAKRFAPWVKKLSSDDLSAVQEYYGYSIKKAQQALALLTEEQLTRIRQKLNKGGSSDDVKKRQRK
jgi:hypothetical protein